MIPGLRLYLNIATFRGTFSPMQAAIITIGDEILIGQIADTNSQWLASTLNSIGIHVHQITSISDRAVDIRMALDRVAPETGLVILTGGLGPTNDDITKLTLTQYFGDELINHTETEQHIRTLFRKMNYPFTELNRKQALVPASCIPLLNEWGTAPGMWFEHGDKIVISLPGVPYEMKGIMEHRVIPKLKERFELPCILHRTILTQGMGESMVAERIADWESSLPDDLALAYLPSYGKVRLRLTARGSDCRSLEALLDKFGNQLLKLLPDIVIGEEDGQSWETGVGAQLKRKGYTIALAESCTGGGIARKITSVPGASSYFKGGMVVYSSEVKTALLGVRKESIAIHSVVSEEVAVQMAQKIRDSYKTTFGLSTTGNAGPTTDDTDEEAGVVFIGIATPDKAFAVRFFFGKPREKVMERASNKALEMLYREILKY
jgi:nicotinamide-nucleotide amidase